jgi:hypothetical protein
VHPGDGQADAVVGDAVLHTTHTTS